MQGFNAINESELAGAKESGLTYYQVRLVLIVFNHSSQNFLCAYAGLEQQRMAAERWPARSTEIGQCYF